MAIHHLLDFHVQHANDLLQVFINVLVVPV